LAKDKTPHTTLATVSQYKITCTRAHDLFGKASVIALALPFVLGSARDSAKQRQRTTREHQRPHPRGAPIGRLSASGEAAQLSALAYQTALRGRASRPHQQSRSQRRFDRVSGDLLLTGAEMPLLRHLRLRNDHQAEFASKTIFSIKGQPGSRRSKSHDSRFSVASSMSGCTRSTHALLLNASACSTNP
jgi:hypothetical protein